MAALAGVVIGLRPGGVVLARRPVNVIVAGTARRATGRGLPVVCVRRAGLVARGAVANLLRESNVRKIRAVDKVRLASDNTRKTGAPVQLMHHHFEIDSAAAIDVGALWAVA